jgi:hypothetical protein
MRTAFVSLVVLSLVGLFILVGCGGSDTSGEKTPAQIQADAQKMTADQLTAAVTKAKTALADAEKKLADLQAELGKLSVTDVAGEKGKQLTVSVDAALKVVNNLKEEIKIYTTTLAEKKPVTD